MEQANPVIGIAILLAAALVGGMIAHRLKQPVILGYLIVGVAIGPHSLGLVQDLVLVEASATIGVALLMFTLGLEVSGHQLKQVGRVGLWGGILQIILTALLGLAAGTFVFHWTVAQSALFGLIISLSSTAVCLKILMDRGEMDSVHGRIMIAVLILQDIAVVLMTVVVPLLNGALESLPAAIAFAIGKALLFVGIAVVSGIYVLPWLMGRVGGVRSRELFLLTVLVLSLGAALGTQIVGLSAVFGAFIVGLVLHESRFAYQALAEITPLRDIFATLFFVSLGMLLDPAFVVARWQLVLATVSVIVFIKVLVVFGIVRLFGFGSRVAFIAGIGLFQLGEFGFLLAQAGMNAGVVTDEFYALILASAILTMLLTPLSTGLASGAYPWLSRLLGRTASLSEENEYLAGAEDSLDITPEVILAGYGRTGRNIASGLREAGVPHLVIDIDPERVDDARETGSPRIYGDSSNPNVLAHADLKSAKMLVVTFPDPVAVITTVKEALQINPGLRIVARVHRAHEADMLKELGVTELVNPEYEASMQFLKRVLEMAGEKKADMEKIVSEGQKKGEYIEFEPDERFA